MEKAIQLEFENRPEVINVESLRADYAGLFTRYEAVIDAASTLEVELPEDLFARIVRAADQWRSLEDDPSTCCEATARLLGKINRPELRWAYLTTPLVGHSGESTRWRQLAGLLSADVSDLELADLAFLRAFECEQTNPEILLEHAKLLKNHGDSDRSQQLLRKITDSSWQPRFSKTQARARQLLIP